MERYRVCWMQVEPISWGSESLIFGYPTIIKPTPFPIKREMTQACHYFEHLILKYSPSGIFQLFAYYDLFYVFLFFLRKYLPRPPISLVLCSVNTIYIEDVYLLIHFQKCHFQKCHFRKCHFWKCQNQNFLQKCQNDPNNHIWEYLKMTLLIVSFLKVSKIESVRVDRHPQ